MHVEQVPPPRWRCDPRRRVLGGRTGGTATLCCCLDMDLQYTRFNASLSAVPSSTYEIGALLEGCVQAHLDPCPFPAVLMQAVNTGNATSDYVALVFAQGECGPKPYPIKTLVALCEVGTGLGEAHRSKER
ncbi:hypothetical protein B0T25DRAFT_613961 [Lasiosphaeria hispida]|uniref:Uncharacterized protein n=1 Tax=Lasiosphaeria hispida TaxID=260671 RepID=A0AAJ0HD71_9PEZI|nr:hypothetical protein B0T25DRAFT_613961 [Lasiosphaeria hispida]